MASPAARRLKIGALLAESAGVYAARAGAFLPIVLIPSITIAVLSFAFFATVLGFASESSVIDPATFFLELTKVQWLIIAGGVLLTSIAGSLAAAATVHVAAGAPGIRAAFGASTSKSMQIFWLQCVIYALAARFSPWAALLLWLPIALGVPVALLENLGPAEATDRAWALSEGNRIRLLAVELGLLLPPVAALLIEAWVFIFPNAVFSLTVIEPSTRAAISWLMVAFLLIPVQFIFVVMTLAYKTLSASEPALHAKAASNVTS